MYVRTYAITDVQDTRIFYYFRITTNFTLTSWFCTTSMVKDQRDIRNKLTVNVERLAGPNISGFSPMKFFIRILYGALASIDYLTTAKYSWENFVVLLKTAKFKHTEYFHLYSMRV